MGKENTKGGGTARADKARAAAAKAVMRLHAGGWANLTAKQALEAPGLAGRDKAFAAALFYGTAERLVTLDYLLQPFLKKPVAKLDAEVRAVLETGLYQILYMNTPPRAAVDEAVKLTRSLGKTSAAGLVNAVLRKSSQVSTTGMQFTSEQLRVEVTWSLSPAVAAAVMQALPEEYEDFLAASFAGDETCLRANSFKTTGAALLERFAQNGVAAHSGSLPGALYATLPGGVANDPLFAEGLYHVQGEASQYVCANVGAQSGMRVLDACAAPGGKSATMAQGMGGGAGLTCCDVRENRLPLIEETFQRLGVAGAAVLYNDAAVYNEALCGQHRVLCDVPCSGLGTLAAKPDIRYADGARFAALPPLQLQILETSARYVLPGGRLVYSTCTIRREENECVVRAFLAKNSQFRAVAPTFVPKGAVLRDETVTILPHRTGLDGFFVATMERL